MEKERGLLGAGVLLYLIRNVFLGIEIECQPAIQQKMSQLLDCKPNIDELEFSRINDQTRRFVQDLKSFALEVTEEPRLLKPNQKMDILLPDLPIAQKNSTLGLPADVRAAVQKANDCFRSGHFEASSVMFRKAVDIAIRKGSSTWTRSEDAF
ncbi:MAG: hypothetical protein PXY39_09535 [archaeon]|nr:hypothetical protein [archaeon]